MFRFPRPLAPPFPAFVADIRFRALQLQQFLDLAQQLGKSKGLNAYPSMPASRKLRRLSFMASAVRAMIGILARPSSFSSSRMRLVVSRPFISGIWMSMSTMSNRPTRNASKASLPLSANTSRCPMFSGNAGQ